MNIPKIKFLPMSLERNIERVIWAFLDADNSDLDVRSSAIELFNELSQLDINLPRKFLEEKIKEIVTINYNKNYKNIEEEVIRYNRLWESYNDKYFTLLSEYLGVDWPADKLIIEAEIGIIPTCPRFLSTFSFQLFTDISELHLIRICMHETLHFLWFEKWKKIHPETEIIGDEMPYLIWKYSEMVTDPILNNKPFSDILPIKEEGYDSFYEIYDNDTLVMDNLRELYSKDISIEEKINKGFKYIERLEIKKSEDRKKL